jgi:type I restriction enzyme R subunit
MNLVMKATRAYIEGAFRNGAIQHTGMEITRVLPPVSRFSPTGEHAIKKATVIRKLSGFFGLS